MEVIAVSFDSSDRESNDMDELRLSCRTWESFSGRTWLPSIPSAEVLRQLRNLDFFPFSVDFSGKGQWSLSFDFYLRGSSPPPFFSAQLSVSYLLRIAAQFAKFSCIAASSAIITFTSISFSACNKFPTGH